LTFLSANRSRAIPYSFSDCFPTSGPFPSRQAVIQLRESEEGKFSFYLKDFLSKPWKTRKTHAAAVSANTGAISESKFNHSTSTLAGNLTPKVPDTSPPPAINSGSNSFSACFTNVGRSLAILVGLSDLFSAFQGMVGGSAQRDPYLYNDFLSRLTFL
jgi:hypothetical protein